jgi:hypothetical protein
MNNDVKILIVEESLARFEHLKHILSNTIISCRLSIMVVTRSVAAARNQSRRAT